MVSNSPAHISIGTKRAFAKGYDFKYSYNETLNAYVCEKGSEWARPSECLALMKENEEWIAYDALCTHDKASCRQAVFKSTSNILEEGWHIWEINYSAGKENENDVLPDWQGDNWHVQTQHRAVGRL